MSRRGDDVWRLEFEPRFAPLLRSLADAESLARALAAAVGEVDDPSSASGLQRALAEWVSSGLFAGERLD